MKALVFKQYGGAEHIAFADTPRPVPKPDEFSFRSTPPA
jgi:NADPH:quinone reductase-like Zn-dependent oxidoreductase